MFLRISAMRNCSAFRMRCISVSSFGGPEVLKLIQSAPVPKPMAGQVLVRVKASGVNPVDTYVRSGSYSNSPSLPYVPGKDGSGIVHQIGESVARFQEGDRVWFYKALTGSYAEYCLVDESTVHRLSSNISFDAGAAIGTPYLTAYRALVHKGHAARGETVLIHGATGGVGTAAVQLALSLKMRVIGTAGSAAGKDMLLQMGVERVFNHREKGYLDVMRQDLSDCRPDLILEMLANVNLAEDLKIVRRHGRVVVVGSRGSVEISPRDMMDKECSVTGFLLFNAPKSELDEAADYVQLGLNSGWLSPCLWKSLLLESASEAHTDIMTNSGALGQITLCC